MFQTEILFFTWQTADFFTLTAIVLGGSLVSLLLSTYVRLSRSLSFFLSFCLARRVHPGRWSACRACRWGGACLVVGEDLSYSARRFLGTVDEKRRRSKRRVQVAGVFRFCFSESSWYRPVGCSFLSDKTRKKKGISYSSVCKIRLSCCPLTGLSSFSSFFSFSTQFLPLSSVSFSSRLRRKVCSLTETR